MKININPEEDLFKWGPISIRLIYPSGFIFGILPKITKYYDWPWPPHVSFIRSSKHFIWINSYADMRATGLKYFKKYLLVKNNYNDLWKRWENWIKDYEALESSLVGLFRKPVFRTRLIREVKKMSDLVISFWLIVHVPEIANWGGEQLLKDELAKINPARRDEYLEILSAPVKFSFFQEEELALLRLAAIKDKKELAVSLKEHAREWHWILNSYGGNRILSPKYFGDKLKELLEGTSAEEKIKEIKNKIAINEKRKLDLAKKLKLSPATVLIAEQLSQSIWWQDLRKGYIWRQNHLWDLILRAVEKETSWSFKDLQWCFFYELEKVLQGKIDKSRVLKRKKNYVFCSENGKLEESFDKKIFQKLWKEYAEEKSGQAREIKGLAVSRGKGGIITGRVRIITDPFKEQKKFIPGEILVTGMTSPEYIVIMKKAKAIITDYGGMTCHAAIVSRELGVPCLVDTRQATKILKDGDMVEMDLEKGTIKIIKQ